MQKIIELNDIKLELDSNFLLYENFNLTINKGDMVAIVGLSGAGKTTIFKLLSRYLKPTFGTVKIFEKNINKLNKKEWNQIIKKIGFLSQKTNLIPSQNVYNNILKALKNHKNIFYKLLNIPDQQKHQKIFEILNDLKILEKAFYRVDTLSGGQQQRVEIAKLLLEQVDLILADEPTSNLDFKNSSDVMELLRELNKTKNITILVNIHDLNLALEKFDQIIVLKEGRVALHKNTNETTLCEIKKLLS
ncbi:phosphonate ABC transporter ATP-binding protein [Mycoplasmopsis alligatoris]|uniref:ABC transporter, ATP-binding protein n=1 Tax=Mycoplasmopsis alligatoris A21JP2 TaxID=747682 RepID=D4XV19_9BACT|nr:ATP-binding cassette domain-containing protein [Mycoplasmopsis alligatoris]EFF41827.1 ABC transporter, ATP-binding protein [Mycoplasmopsis alligatoris A21JP2]